MDDALDDLGVVALFIGQLAGPEVVAEDSRGLPRVAAACWELSIAARAELRRQLCAAFGSEADLFVSLWRSTGRVSEGGEDSEAENWEVLNSNLSSGKMKGFEWLTDGCPVLHGRGDW